MTVWTLNGTDQQRQLVREALDRCDFPWDRLLPSLAREGKSSIRVDWEDLSRYNDRAARAHDDDHSHVTDGDAVAHPIEREVDGRKRVLGLFYLPPHTRVVLDVYLVNDPELAREVFLAEGAHAADYHWLMHQPDGRRAVTNLLHRDDLPAGHSTADGVAFNLDGHTCSWFDVNSYAWWVGEAFMETFIEATSDVRVTIELRHPTTPEVAAAVRRDVLGITDAPFPDEPVVEPPTDVAAKPVFAKKNGYVVHDQHAGIDQARWWDSLDAALADGMRPCKTCRP